MGYMLPTALLVDESMVDVDCCVRCGCWEGKDNTGGWARTTPELIEQVSQPRCPWAAAYHNALTADQAHTREALMLEIHSANAYGPELPS